ncbi:hypothetical protein ACSFBX_27310 [Variovorax sp. RB2P76]|uniref:hypothetical protein n=1 Tax=Variovorax sp. RB2P76 TaxID=3443736 RepID=UPI003F48092B
MDYLLIVQVFVRTPVGSEIGGIQHTDFVSFAMAVHSDLLEVKYDIEYGEHSLRRFFSELVFKAANRKGPEGAAAGLALEADFQSLLASEINHHARGRYSVTVESNTAEAKRRDVLCSRGEWHASVELKMSMRWTLDDYVEALEKQLVGQYMRHRRAAVGFLVVVLQQKGRQWRDPATAKLVGFDEVLEILRGKAQAIEANDRTKYLRVIGIDATTPQNFRKTGQGTTRKDPLTVVAPASSGKARSPRPTGGQPAVKLPRADRAPKAAVRRVRSVRTR